MNAAATFAIPLVIIIIDSLLALLGAVIKDSIYTWYEERCAQEPYCGY